MANGLPSATTITKKFLGCLGGAVFGTLFHIGVVRGLPLPPVDKFIFGACMTFALSIGFGFSDKVRCICLLILPNFFGKYGRGFLSSAAMTAVLVGPVANTLQNAQESARSIACTAALTLNHSMEIIELGHKPFTAAFNDIGGQTGDVNELADQMKEEFEVLRQKVEEGNAKKKSHRSREFGDGVEKKFEFKCESMFDAAAGQCKESMSDLKDRCLNKIGIPGLKWAMCAPMTATFVCDIVNLLKPFCQNSPVDTAQMGEEYLTAKEKVKDIDNDLKADINWRVVSPDVMQVFRSVSVSEIQQNIRYEVSKRKIWFDGANKLVSVLLSFAFLLVFLSANNYNSSYLTDLRFDNNYQTEYFDKIDKRREEKNQKHLLPLKKSEKKEILPPLVLKMTKEERSKVVYGTVKLSGQIFVTLLLIAFDHFFYTGLDLIHRHSEVGVTVSGEHTFVVEVDGEGGLARLLKRIFRAFDNTATIASVSTNKECLPVPTKLNISGLLQVIILLLATWGMIYFEAWGLRFRRLLCAYYYPKREKTRVLFLYNDCLRKRAGWLKCMRRRVRRLAREEILTAKLSTTTMLLAYCPTLCGWMTLLGVGKKKCLVCNETERGDSYTCQTEGCLFLYCKECWNDVKVCYACFREEQTDESDRDVDSGEE